MRSLNEDVVAGSVELFHTTRNTFHTFPKGFYISPSYIKAFIQLFINTLLHQLSLWHTL